MKGIVKNWRALGCVLAAGLMSNPADATGFPAKNGTVDQVTTRKHQLDAKPETPTAPYWHLTVRARKADPETGGSDFEEWLWVTYRSVPKEKAFPGVAETVKRLGGTMSRTGAVLEQVQGVAWRAAHRMKEPLVCHDMRREFRGEKEIYWHAGWSREVHCDGQIIPLSAQSLEVWENCEELEYARTVPVEVVRGLLNFYLNFLYMGNAVHVGTKRGIEIGVRGPRAEILEVETGRPVLEPEEEVESPPKYKYPIEYDDPFYHVRQRCGGKVKRKAEYYKSVFSGKGTNPIVFSHAVSPQAVELRDGVRFATMGATCNNLFRMQVDALIFPSSSARHRFWKKKIDMGSYAYQRKRLRDAERGLSTDETDLSRSRPFEEMWRLNLRQWERYLDLLAGFLGSEEPGGNRR